jgi:hypothetical protein
MEHSSGSGWAAGHEGTLGAFIVFMMTMMNSSAAELFIGVHKAQHCSPSVIG